MASRFSFIALLILVNLMLIHASIIFEEGYTVTTIIDGYKLGINPHSVLPVSASSDLIILDSSGSTVYTFSFSNPKEGGIKRFAGNGVASYSDGDLGSATFNKPRSFALDLKNNVYVADRNNHAIRKISKSGVTTIAGGYTQAPGKADGPGQNVSFSDDFELVFIPQICALMISDHGTKLVRQLNLKAEDCASGSKAVLWSASVWALGLGLGLACLLGLILGFVIRPYVRPYTGSFQPTSSQRDMEALPNQSGDTSTDVLLRHQKRNC